MLEPRHRILITGRGFQQPHLDMLLAAGLQIEYVPVIAQGHLLELLPEVDGYILGGDERLGADEIRLASRLRLISFVGTDAGNFVDESAAEAHGIVVLRTPAVMASAVAEHTVGLVIGLCRGLFAQNDGVKRTCRWSLPTNELADIDVGIVGMGAVGSRVAKVLSGGFGCRLRYYSRSRKNELERDLSLRFTELRELFASSAVVILLLPTSPETINLVDSSLLSIVPTGMFLVNTAGATLVDPRALLAALLSGQVQSAAFDGYWIEPLPMPKDDPYGLLSLPDDKFVVTPHAAAQTVGTWTRMLDMAVTNVVSAVASGTLLE